MRRGESEERTASTRLSAHEPSTATHKSTTEPTARGKASHTRAKGTSSRNRDGRDGSDAIDASAGFDGGVGARTRDVAELLAVVALRAGGAKGGTARREG